LDEGTTNSTNHASPSKFISHEQNTEHDDVVLDHGSGQWSELIIKKRKRKEKEKGEEGRKERRRKGNGKGEKGRV
jgi:hypothetical protein